MMAMMPPEANGRMDADMMAAMPQMMMANMPRDDGTHATGSYAGHGC